MPPPTTPDNCLRNSRSTYAQIRCHCEPQRGVAIRIPCGAKHRPAPPGPERERIATSHGFLAMTEVTFTRKQPTHNPGQKGRVKIM